MAEAERAVESRTGGDRRSRERRAAGRHGPGRRTGDRRRRQVHGVLLAAAALATAHQVRHKPPASRETAGPEPQVSVTIQGFKTARPEEVYEGLIQEAARKYRLDAELIRAVMRAESAFDPNAVSRVGAQGLMQIMPSLAADMGVTDPFDPRQNVMAGAKYLRQLLDRHRGNIALTLASYNAGPGNVRRYRGIPPFKETRNYVRKITGFLAEAEAEAAAED